MRRTILLIFIVLWAAASAGAASQRVPFRLYHDYLIVVTCSVSGQQGLTAIIDTGTTETILDMGLVRRLSLETRPDSAISLTREAEAWGVSIRDLELGPIQVQKLDGIAMDLGGIGQDLGVNPDVVIGMDVLRRSSFSVDYGSHSITFGAVDEKLARGHSARLEPDDRFALVDATIGGQALRLQVDTGFNGLLVYGSRLKAAVLTEGSAAHLAGISQRTNVRTVDSADVRVGEWAVPRVKVSIIENPPSGVKEFDGVLSPRLLAAHRVAFDFERYALYWD